MGFDVDRIRMFEILTDPDWDFGLRHKEEVSVAMGEHVLDGSTLFDPAGPGGLFRFTPHPGWVGQIELEPTKAPPPAGERRAVRLD